MLHLFTENGRYHGDVADLDAARQAASKLKESGGARVLTTEERVRVIKAEGLEGRAAIIKTCSQPV